MIAAYPARSDEFPLISSLRFPDLWLGQSESRYLPDSPGHHHGA